MIIRPKNQSKDGKIKGGLFCGRCGKPVPFNKKYLTNYYQQKIKGIDRWIVSLGYICPMCGTVTIIPHLNYSKSQSDVIKKINLYGEHK